MARFLLSLFFLVILPLVASRHHSTQQRRLALNDEAPQCGEWLKQADGWHCQRLASNYLLHWRVNASRIMIGVEVQPTDGLIQLDWVGIGLSEAGGMPGADIALMRRDPDAPADSSWLLEDRWSEQFARPQMDTQQDNVPIAFEEDASQTIRAVFERALAPCDTAQDRRIDPGVASYVIYAFGAGSFGYHGPMNRGEAVVTFIPAEPLDESTPANEERTQSLAITMPPQLVPTESTDAYMCLDVELPGNTSLPYHLIDFKGVINTTQGSQPMYVHHMVLYNCTGKPASFGTGTYRCDGTPKTCSSYILIWTPGSGVTTFPPEAGFRLGSGGGMHYATLQIHYNNVLQDEVVDASGFQVTYTPDLRPHDMGVLALGWEEFRVPANSTWSTGPSICPPGCTSKFKEPLNIVRNLLHMHQIGFNMTTQHITFANNNTGGQELRPISTRNKYNFKYQPAVQVPSETSILMPGDALVTTCTFRNPNTSPVKFGLRTQDEMCFSFVWYWPQSATVGITACLDIPFVQQGIGRTVCGNSSAEDTLTRMYLEAYSSTKDFTAATQIVALKAIAAGILVPSRQEILTTMTPYDPLPSDCPVA